MDIAQVSIHQMLQSKLQTSIQRSIHFGQTPMYESLQCLVQTSIQHPIHIGQTSIGQTPMQIAQVARVQGQTPMQKGQGSIYNVSTPIQKRQGSMDRPLSIGKGFVYIMYRPLYKNNRGLWIDPYPYRIGVYPHLIFKSNYIYNLEQIVIKRLNCCSLH